MAYEYSIGSSIGTLALLTTLGITSNPRPAFRPFSDAVEAGDGTLKGQGSPVIEWHWDVMRPGESDILAAYLSGNLSAPVYIRTRLNRLTTSEYTWATYSCIMRWPAGDEDIQSKRNLSLTLSFTHPVLIPDEE